MVHLLRSSEHLLRPVGHGRWRCWHCEAEGPVLAKLAATQCAKLRVREQVAIAEAPPVIGGVASHPSHRCFWAPSLRLWMCTKCAAYSARRLAKLGKPSQGFLTAHGRWALRRASRGLPV